MAKRYDEPIDVTTDSAGWEADAPLAFAWRGKRYFVDERLSSWREAGEWWLPRTNGRSTQRAAGSAGAPYERAAGSAGAPYEREYFRVVAHPAGTAATGELDAEGFIINNSSVYDIYRDRLNGSWRMGRVWD